MRLIRALGRLKVIAPAAACWFGLQAMGFRPQMAGNKVEVKMLSKKGFVNDILDEGTGSVVLIIFPTLKLRSSELADRERDVIALSKLMAEKLGGSVPNLKILIMKEEEFQVLKTAWESTSGSKMPIDLEKNKEIQVYFKRSGFSHIFPISEALKMYSIEEARTSNAQSQLQEYLSKLINPVLQVNTSEELVTELVKNVGINGQPILVDVCEKNKLPLEKAKLEQIIMKLLRLNTIPPETSVILVDSSLLQDAQLTNKIGVFKNDFLELHRLHSVCSKSEYFKESDPIKAAMWYKAYLEELLKDSLRNSRLTGMLTMKDNQEMVESIEQLLLPDVPLISQVCEQELEKFYSHIHANRNKKILSLNLMKENPATPNNIEMFVRAIRSQQFSNDVCFQVFVESSFSNYMKELNRYYSPFTLFDLGLKVGKSHQKLFVEAPLGCSYSSFANNLQDALNRSKDPTSTDLVDLSSDFMPQLSTRGLEYLTHVQSNKIKISLLFNSTDPFNLVYETSLVKRFHTEDNFLLSKLYSPDTISAISQNFNLPAIAVCQPNSDNWRVVELKPHFESQDELDSYLSKLFDFIGKLD